jgi:hypothetical protein
MAKEFGFLRTRPEANISLDKKACSCDIAMLNKLW